MLSRGPFQYFLVTLMTCSCLAAIMSTADSALMGASSIVSLDIFKGTLFPSMSKKNVVRFGELTSVVICSLAFFLGMFMSDDQMGVIIIFQNGMLMQLLPAFGFGLFWQICERPVCSGIVAGLVSLIILTITGNPLDGYVPAVNISVFVNFLTVALMCVFAPGPSREKEEQLDVPQIRTSGTNPLVSRWKTHQHQNNHHELERQETLGFTPNIPQARWNFAWFDSHADGQKNEHEI